MLAKLGTALVLALLVQSGPLFARADKPADTVETPVPPLVVSVTRGSGSFGGVTVNYKATAGETYLKDKDGKPLAAIFSTAYVREGPVDPNRPVTFLFNGGPGSASV